ncbi:hypothetical protein Tco_1457087 [Tanacetum coccineum]
MHPCIAWDKVDNPSPQSTPQVLPSFKVYTPPVTYPEEVDETIGIPMEVEPLDHRKLEDLGLNTCSHDLFSSSREIPSIEEPEPQLLLNFSPLDVNLGDQRGIDPPINPYSLGSFRMKVVKPLTIHTPPSPHVAYLHQNGKDIKDKKKQKQSKTDKKREKTKTRVKNEEIKSRISPIQQERPK